MHSTILALTTSFALTTLLLMPIGCGDDADDAGGAGEAQIPCDVDADCPAPPCNFSFCISGFCSAPSAGPDAADEEADQVDGDCMLIGCRGGEYGTFPDSGDPPPDPNLNDCMVPSCFDGEAIMQQAGAGTACEVADVGPGVCQATGECTCTPTNANDDHFVDPVNGVDMASQGGAAGGCAFRTVAFALTQANREVVLAPGDYVPSEAEVFPWVLEGRRRITCPSSDDTTSPARIAGEGMFEGVGMASIVFNGDENELDGCDVDGGGTNTGALIVVNSVAENENDEHVIRNADVHDSTGDGILVTASGSRVEVSDSQIRNNGAEGIEFAGPNPIGELE
ncbi:MAG: DUF1565 domain-containing protein, partial [Myxococcota bacterium]